MRALFWALAFHVLVLSLFFIPWKKHVSLPAMPVELWDPSMLPQEKKPVARTIEPTPLPPSPRISPQEKPQEPQEEEPEEELPPEDEVMKPPPPEAPKPPKPVKRTIQAKPVATESKKPADIALAASSSPKLQEKAKKPPLPQKPAPEKPRKKPEPPKSEQKQTSAKPAEKPALPKPTPTFAQKQLTKPAPQKLAQAKPQPKTPAPAKPAPAPKTTAPPKPAPSAKSAPQTSPPPKASQAMPPQTATPSSAAAGQKALSQAKLGLLEEYKRRIHMAIYNRLEPLPCSPGGRGLVVEMQARLLPTGELAATPLIRRSSGYPACDAAVLRAVMDASPLPVPASPALFSQMAELLLEFHPNEE